MKMLWKSVTTITIVTLATITICLLAQVACSGHESIRNHRSRISGDRGRSAAIIDHNQNHRRRHGKHGENDRFFESSKLSSSTVKYNFWGSGENVKMTTPSPPRIVSGRVTNAIPSVPSIRVDDRRSRAINFNVTNSQLPVSLFLELKNITNPVDFLNRYVIEDLKHGVMINGHPSVRPGHNHSFVSSIMRERTLSAPFANAAGCTPQPTTIPIEVSDTESYVMYFPSCTRIERCDGCCNTELLECQPTKTEMTSLQVLRVKYLGPDVNKFDVSEPVIVELERHLQCDCQCRVKESDCRFYQTYRPNQCRCECSNQEEAVNCIGERLWDSVLCQCRCRQYHDCSTGYFFNDQTCLCEMMRTGRNHGPGVRPSFRGFK